VEHGNHPRGYRASNRFAHSVRVAVTHVCCFFLAGEEAGIISTPGYTTHRGGIFITFRANPGARTLEQCFDNVV
jgi:hypothetical protein